MKFSIIILSLALATPLLASPVVLDSRQPVTELTSRNPATDLDKRDLSQAYCIYKCAKVDKFCQTIGITLDLILDGLFDVVDNALCIPAYCLCQRECEKAPADYFCYKKNGGPLPDVYKVCTEKCCGPKCK